MRKLFIIPARGGSKGIKRKNIKLLHTQPLIKYSLDVAREIADSEDVICVSTNDLEIKEYIENQGVNVPFIRPEELSSDTASTNDVIRHAIDFYLASSIIFDVIILLQPTSPLRKSFHVKDALEKYSKDVDMVVSVVETKSNPYYVLFEEENDFLKKSKEGTFYSRQECPTVYEYNGAVYIINPDSIQHKTIVEFEKVKKYLMDSRYSIDIDDIEDWEYAEYLLKHGKRN